MFATIIQPRSILFIAALFIGAATANAQDLKSPPESPLPVPATNGQEIGNDSARIKVFVVYYVHKDDGRRYRHGHHTERRQAEIWVEELRRAGHREIVIVIEEIDG